MCEKCDATPTPPKEEVPDPSVPNHSAVPQVAQIPVPEPASECTWTPRDFISGALLLMFIMVFIAEYVFNHKASDLLIGALIANVTTVISFYFGTSRGKQTQDATISNLASSAQAALANSAPVVVGPPGPQGPRGVPGRSGHSAVG